MATHHRVTVTTGQEQRVAAGTGSDRLTRQPAKSRLTRRLVLWLALLVPVPACDLIDDGSPTAPTDNNPTISSDGGTLGRLSTVARPDTDGWTTFGPINVSLAEAQRIGDRGTIRFGVRDHECEDGDQVSVNVHNRQTNSWYEVFRGEIFNHWQWRDHTVTAGYYYTVDVVALNGTGFKGNCSWADANTGELFISNVDNFGNGGHWNTTGGAGARTVINVYVP